MSRTIFVRCSDADRFAVAMQQLSVFFSDFLWASACAASQHDIVALPVRQGNQRRM
jgi:hypothetical protein